MNHTARSFILIGLVVCILLAMHLLPEITINDTELRHVNVLCDILPEAYQERDAIDVIPMPEPPKPLKTRKTVVRDSTKAGESQEAIQEVEVVGLVEPEGETMIVDYSEGAAGGMDHFYSQLTHAASQRVVRIAYYGDSFIEGDVLTADLREMLQSRFGGNGVGWVDCIDRLSGFRKTVKLKGVGMKGFEVVSKPYNHQVEGISQRYFVPSENARTWASGAKSRKHLNQWQHASLFLRTESGLNVTTYANSDTIGTEWVEGGPQVQMLSYGQETMTGVGYLFTEVTSPTYLYGMALESQRGVILDNFSMRGSSGYSLARIPLQTLNDFARLRPYDLIVVHFGLNVASDQSHAASYRAYIKNMQTAIEHLRKAYPQASVLIVSMPDRDQRTDAGIRTMQGVESLVAYQQIMASNCHVAYFNLFQAMGGRESMKALVDKGLAAKDYTHITFAGGRKLAQLVYDGLMEGYENYQRRQ